ncbi:hypothetical protein Q73_15495 [Bacillus coahuilensis m2-6]|uniref:rhomboid family intramembrane serine protease n=1 Tax=Bacillus coahuilensis TaxID=408580 RepID=UPI0007500942|nr:rhomboid family intramembrane serine protease [Bacillus coahuilensis]KUP04527.1 hypothetical protein Q73_15495 [Bacillus coahuilensis m2-6]
MFQRTESFSAFSKSYPVITTIILFQVLLYALTKIPLLPHIWLFEWFGGVNLYIMQGEWWRLVTSIFLHYSLSHLVFNSLTLLLFGPYLEQFIGSIRFSFVYIAGGIFGNLATLWIEEPSYSHVGASGSLFSLIGFYIGLGFASRTLPLQPKPLIIIIAVTTAALTFGQPDVNVLAHIGGLVGGGLLVPFILYRKGK